MQSFIITEGEYSEINQKLDRILQSIGVTQSQAEPLLTSDELMAYLKICNRTLQNYRDRKIIPFYKIGRRTFYNKAEVIIALAKFKSIEKNRQ